MAQDMMTNLLGEVIDEQHKSVVELLNEARQLIIDTYTDPNDKQSIVVRCSFGKDSSILLKLVFEAIMSLPREQWDRHMYIVCSDTLVETPIIKHHVNSESEKVQQLIDKHNFPMSMHIVYPDLEDSYFYEILGLGYPLPSNSERRCTDNLKIKPMKKFLKDIEYSTILTGVRLSESRSRRKTYSGAEDKRMIDEDGKLLVMPLLEFWVEDIWEAAQAQFPWGSSLPLRRHYAEATGECGFKNPRGTEKSKVDACGARFGCFVCPVVAADQSTEQMAEHHDWLIPYTVWRTLQMKVFGKYVPVRESWMNDREWKKERQRWDFFNHRMKQVTKSGFRRDGTVMDDGEGCLLIEAREYLLKRLLEAQDEINELRAEVGLPPDELISQAELDLILKQHEEDRKEWPWLTKGIQDIERAMEEAMEQVERELELPFDPNKDTLFAY